MDKVAMALDDVIKADKKPRGGPKGKGRKNNAGKKGANKPKAAAAKAKAQPSTAKLVQKLVKKALAQNGVTSPARPRNNRTKPKPGPSRGTIVRKVVRKIVTTPSGGRRNLGISQRSRVIRRRPVTQSPQTVVREIRYVQAPQPRRRVLTQQPRVIYQQAPAPRRQLQQRPVRRVVYVDAPQQSRGGRRNDPFYEPQNFLQRVPSNRY